MLLRSPDESFFRILTCLFLFSLKIQLLLTMALLAFECHLIRLPVGCQRWHHPSVSFSGPQTRCLGKRAQAFARENTPHWHSEHSQMGIDQGHWPGSLWNPYWVITSVSTLRTLIRYVSIQYERETATLPVASQIWSKAFCIHLFEKQMNFSVFTAFSCFLLCLRQDR